MKMMTIHNITILLKLNNDMKKFLYKLSLLLVALVAILPMQSCCERIDAGHEGILVNLYGDDKGVGEISMCTGMVWYNPFTKQVFEYPTFAQTIDYEPFEVNSKDGTKFTIDPSMIVKIEDGKSPVIFKKYRKKLNEVIDGSLYIYVKDAARIVFNQFTADSIISNRALVDKTFDNQVRNAFAKENFVLEQLTPGISYPKSYEDAINAKNKAVQDEMRVLNEVKVAEANAKVAEANAKKRVVEAQAEAEANRLRNTTLTPAVLEKAWIDKWNGVLPQYSSVPFMYKDISKH